MKIAIIGAGIAGLTCALELEKHGEYAVIFERRSFIGEEFDHVGAALEVAHRPIKDAVEYLSANFGISIKPLNTVNKVIHYSPNKTTEVKGQLGYFLERSKGPADIKIQLHAQLRGTRILFNEYGDYSVLSKHYDYVVAANGNESFAAELGCWKDWVSTYVRGAVVSGEFDPNTMHVWVNKDYCRNGYAYLTPFNSRRASLVLVTTEVSEREVDEYWNLFLYTENIKYNIEQEFKLNHKSGYVYPHKVGNIYLAGNAGGMMDPFLGFGVLGSLISGVMAARSILEGYDYEKLLDTMVKQNLQLHELRKGFDLANNAFYDLMISSIGLPGLKHIIYYTPLNVVKLGAGLLKLLPKGGSRT